MFTHSNNSGLPLYTTEINVNRCSLYRCVQHSKSSALVTIHLRLYTVVMDGLNYTESVLGA